MVRERSDPVPVRTGGASPVRTAERQRGRRRSGACSERRPAQTARIRGGDADTAARRPGQGGEKSKFHDRRARNAQTHGFPPGVTDHPAPMWLTGCPASCPPLRHVPFGCSTFDRRLRSDRDVGRDRQGGRREGRKACGSAARCPGIVRIGLTVLPASHRMAARGRETGERIDRPNPWGSAGQGGRAFPPRTSGHGPCSGRHGQPGGVDSPTSGGGAQERSRCQRLAPTGAGTGQTCKRRDERDLSGVSGAACQGPAIPTRASRRHHGLQGQQGRTRSVPVWCRQPCYPARSMA